MNRSVFFPDVFVIPDILCVQRSGPSPLMFRENGLHTEKRKYSESLSNTRWQKSMGRPCEDERSAHVESNVFLDRNDTQCVRRESFSNTSKKTWK